MKLDLNTFVELPGFVDFVRFTTQAHPGAPIQIHYRVQADPLTSTGHMSGEVLVGQSASAGGALEDWMHTFCILLETPDEVFAVDELKRRADLWNERRRESRVLRNLRHG